MFSTGWHKYHLFSTLKSTLLESFNIYIDQFGAHEKNPSIFWNRRWKKWSFVASVIVFRRRKKKLIPSISSCSVLHPTAFCNFSTRQVFINSKGWMNELRGCVTKKTRVF